MYPTNYKEIFINEDTYTINCPTLLTLSNIERAKTLSPEVLYHLIEECTNIPTKQIPKLTQEIQQEILELIMEFTKTFNLKPEPEPSTTAQTVSKPEPEPDQYATLIATFIISGQLNASEYPMDFAMLMTQTLSRRNNGN